MNILKQIEQGESKTIEFKEKLPKNNSIVKTVIAFANTSGGKLIIGVRDNKEIVGIQDENIFHLQDKIISLLFDSCQPNILPEIYTINIEDKLLLVIEIFRGNLLPYHLKSKERKDGVYIRVGSLNRLADENMLMELQRQRVYRSFDEEENFEFSLDELDFDVIYHEFDKIKKDCNMEKLKNLKLVKHSNSQFLPTNALLIALGEFDNVLIKCARFKGTTMESFIDKKEFTGNLFDILDKAIFFLQNHLNLNANIVGLQRVEEYEIPLLALREIILNAIIHRDYTRNSDIKIAIYDDMVEIISVGGFVNGLTLEDISGGRSELRNRVLANLFKELGYIESWGSGIQKVRKLCKEHNIRFELNEKGTFVEALFYRPLSNTVAPKNVKEVPNTTDNNRIRPNEGNKMPNNAEYDRIAGEEVANTGEYRRIPANKIIEYIQNRGSITSKELQSLMGIKTSRAKEILSTMIDDGILEKVGKTRGSYYILKSSTE